MLYVDAELTVHPLRKERFLFHCERLPVELQRCASPLYRQDHAAACDSAQDAGDRAVTDHWRAMFELLGGVGETVAQPPPEE